jgi:hypothetical protein
MSQLHILKTLPIKTDKMRTALTGTPEDGFQSNPDAGRTIVFLWQGIIPARGYHDEVRAGRAS